MRVAGLSTCRGNNYTNGPLPITYNINKKNRPTRTTLAHNLLTISENTVV